MLAALVTDPYGPLQHSSLWVLSFETALLLAMTSSWVCEINALSVTLTPHTVFCATGRCFLTPWSTWTISSLHDVCKWNLKFENYCFHFLVSKTFPYIDCAVCQLNEVLTLASVVKPSHLGWESPLERGTQSLSQHMASREASGEADGIYGCVLRACADQIKPFFTTIFSLSLAQSFA